MYLDPVTTDPDLKHSTIPKPDKARRSSTGNFCIQARADRVTPLHAGWDFEKTVYEE